MRTRFKTNRVCSSDNYRATHKYHFYYLSTQHEINKNKIEQILNRSTATPLTFDEQVALGRRPYTICFSKKEYLPLDLARKVQDSVIIHWE